MTCVQHVYFPLLSTVITSVHLCNHHVPQVCVYMYAVRTIFGSGFAHVIFILIVSFYVCGRVTVKNLAVMEGQVLPIIIIFIIVITAVTTVSEYYSQIVMYKFAGVYRHEGLMWSNVCQRWYGELCARDLKSNEEVSRRRLSGSGEVGMGEKERYGEHGEMRARAFQVNNKIPLRFMSHPNTITSVGTV